LALSSFILPAAAHFQEDGTTDTVPDSCLLGPEWKALAYAPDEGWCIRSFPVGVRKRSSLSAFRWILTLLPTPTNDCLPATARLYTLRRRILGSVSVLIVAPLGVIRLLISNVDRTYRRVTYEIDVGPPSYTRVIFAADDGLGREIHVHESVLEDDAVELDETAI